MCDHPRIEMTLRFEMKAEGHRPATSGAIRLRAIGGPLAGMSHGL